MKQKQAPFTPRVRFNWGYHDAAADVKNDKVRTVVELNDERREGVKIVSHERDTYYASGYEYGLRDAQDGTYSGDSTLAWDEYLHKPWR